MYKYILLFSLSLSLVAYSNEMNEALILASKNGADSVNNALIEAASYWHLEIVKYLIDQDIDSDIIDRALENTSYNEQIEIVKYLESLK